MCSDSERIAVLGLDKPPVNDSLFNFFYVHWPSCFLQNNLCERKEKQKIVVLYKITQQASQQKILLIKPQ